MRDMTARDRRWTGTARVLLRTRRARRRRDAGAALRALARGGRTAIGLRLRGQRVLLVLDPELAGQLLSGHAASTVKGPALRHTTAMLGDGLLTSEGAAHDRARRLVAPAFSPRRLDGYVSVFARCARECAAGWADGEHRDIHADMAALTLRAAGQALLGTDLTTQAPRVRAGLEAALADFAAAGGSAVSGPGTAWLSAGRGRSRRTGQAGAGGESAREAVHRLVDDIIEQRRTAPAGDRADVLSALLAASLEPGGLTAREVHDHVMTLLLAGHETTASTLTWALYLLGRCPMAQRRVQAEADTIDGRELSAGDLPALPFTRAVITEAIRLYPPAWIIGRTVTAGLDLGGWHLPPGSAAAVSPLLLHRDPRWYPDPDRFDPGRWLGNRPALPRHAYLPFGTGPRACIGEQFAWSESVTVLATLTRSWSFRTDPGLQPALSYQVTLRPAAGMPMTVHARAELWKADGGYPDAG
ncbi:cytochrome P450 [Trebonia kvetii]|nr:cytochrome P450 [Trebonia kvetii]